MSEPVPVQRDDSAVHDIAPSLRADDHQASTAIILLELLLLAVIEGGLIDPDENPKVSLLTLPGIIAGIAISLWYRPAWRCLGFVPVILAIAGIAGFVLTCGGESLHSLLGAFGICIGIIITSILQNRQRFTITIPEKVFIIIGILLIIQNIQLGISQFRNRQEYPFRMHGIGIFSFSFPALLFSWYRLKRHIYELWVESWIRVMYQIRGRGIGMKELPVTGPLLLIANHACWWDPLFIAGVLPRPMTAMMTASFYDIWHLKPFMKYVVRAIRVPEKSLRFEAPEIHEAIAALDRGECVVIFPEGYLRRKEDVPLRRFGRGVHEILKARPNTPVAAAWIEGAWGSWCSWKNGPPTKNKRVDFRRKIEVGLAAPITVPARVLENHWLTRVFLMNAVSRARTQVGLEPFPEFSVPMKGDTEESLR